MFTIRRRTRLRRLATVPLALALGLPLAASGQSSSFFESPLDGSWVGTIAIGDAVAVLQLNLNVHGSGGIGFVMLQDNPGGEPSGMEVFTATVSGASDDGVTVRFEDDEALRARKATTTLSLTYDEDAGELTGKAKGGIKGDVDLARDDPDAPMTRLWEASGKLGGENYYLLFQTQEDDGSSGRFAATPLVGDGWFRDALGTLTGEVNGKNVEITLDLEGDDLTIDAKLKKKDNLLRGTLTLGANSAKLKATPATGVGKTLKFRKVQRAAANQLTIGETSAVVLKGKNFSQGATVHADDAGFEITQVTFTSAKQLDVTIRPDDSVADGATAALAVVNADGQVATKNAAVTAVSGDDNGGNLVSFSAAVQPIFDTNCALAGCHSAASGSAGLVLASGSAFANLVNVPSSQQPGLNRVTPGDAAASYLVRKIEGSSGISGGRMPLNRTPLTQEEIDTIRAWIDEGASNNREAR